MEIKGCKYESSKAENSQLYDLGEESGKLSYETKNPQTDKASHERIQQLVEAINTGNYTDYCMLNPHHHNTTDLSSLPNFEELRKKLFSFQTDSSNSDSDSGHSEFDEEFWNMMPPPIPRSEMHIICAKHKNVYLDGPKDKHEQMISKAEEYNSFFKNEIKKSTNVVRKTKTKNKCNTKENILKNNVCAETKEKCMVKYSLEAQLTSETKITDRKSIPNKEMIYEEVFKNQMTFDENSTHNKSKQTVNTNQNEKLTCSNYELINKETKSMKKQMKKLRKKQRKLEEKKQHEERNVELLPLVLTELKNYESIRQNLKRGVKPETVEKAYTTLIAKVKTESVKNPYFLFYAAIGKCSLDHHIIRESVILAVCRSRNEWKKRSDRNTWLKELEDEYTSFTRADTFCSGYFNLNYIDILMYLATEFNVFWVSNKLMPRK